MKEILSTFFGGSFDEIEVYATRLNLIEFPHSHLVNTVYINQ